MHRRHDHHQHGDGGSESHSHAGPGHNHAHAPRAAQWQTPHRAAGEQTAQHVEHDIDKVEIAFIAGFMDASDPTSFLRLARVPFEMAATDGSKLSLLRVEIEALTDVGGVTPHLGGKSFRYDPLPSGLVSHRRRLRFVYFDGQNLRPLSFAEVRGP
jgi:hypothetical protein